MNSETGCRKASRARKELKAKRRKNRAVRQAAEASRIYRLSSGEFRDGDILYLASGGYHLRANALRFDEDDAQAAEEAQMLMRRLSTTADGFVPRTSFAPGGGCRKVARKLKTRRFDD